MIHPLHLFERLSRIPVAGVLLRAMRGYIVHQSGNQAGSIAFSMVLAMFPLLLLISAAAAYAGAPGEAAQLAARVMEYAPPLVQQALRPVIDEVLGHRSQALVAIGVLGTVWTASSGMQAVRTGLNRAYGVEQGAPFWKARLKVTLFTLVVGLGSLATFSSVVVMPFLWAAVERSAANGVQAVWLGDGLRYGSAFIVLAILYALLYGWLPDLPQRLRTVLPGAVVGAALWLAAAAFLSHALRAASKLLLVYGSFAGVVATLVFLYASAATLIYGAEVNGVLRAIREDRAAARVRPGEPGPEADPQPTQGL